MIIRGIVKPTFGKIAPIFSDAALASVKKPPNVPPTSQNMLSSSTSRRNSPKTFGVSCQDLFFLNLCFCPYASTLCVSERDADPLPAAGAVLHVTFGLSEQMSRGEEISPAGFERARTKERNESCHEQRAERFEEEEKTGQEAVYFSISPAVYDYFHKLFYSLEMLGLSRIYRCNTNDQSE